jgi:hypothetical protein
LIGRSLGTRRAVRGTLRTMAVMCRVLVRDDDGKKQGEEEGGRGESAIESYRLRGCCELMYFYSK